MKSVKVIFIGFVILVTLSFYACSSGELDLDVEEFAMQMEESKNTTLWDVRTPQEYEQGAIAGAKNVNIEDTLFDALVSNLDSTATVFVYCQSGKRSAKAAKAIKKRGIKVYNLAGGINAWQEANKPIVNKN